MAKVEIDESLDIDSLLAELPIDMRNKSLRKATSRAGRVVMNAYKERVPVGDNRHKPELPSLKSSIDMRIRDYADGRRFVAVVGAKWPDGAHAHLVEDGYRVRARGPAGGGSPGAFTGAKIKGKKPLAEAVDTTAKQQERAIIESIVEDIKKRGG